jgi:hypothetical protein
MVRYAQGERAYKDEQNTVPGYDEAYKILRGRQRALALA